MLWWKWKLKILGIDLALQLIEMIWKYVIINKLLLLLTNRKENVWWSKKNNLSMMHKSSEKLKCLLIDTRYSKDHMILFYGPLGPHGIISIKSTYQMYFNYPFKGDFWKRKKTLTFFIRDGMVWGPHKEGSLRPHFWAPIPGRKVWRWDSLILTPHTDTS